MPLFQMTTKRWMIVVASAAIGFAVAPRRQIAGYISYMDSHHNSPIYSNFSTFEVLMMAVVIGAVTYASFIGLLAFLRRLTVRWRIIVVGLLSLLPPVEVLRERWTDRAVYSRERANQLDFSIKFLEENAADHDTAGENRDANWCRTRAKQLRSLWASYDRVARHPWLPAPQ